jgi:hypothetical protein
MSKKIVFATLLALVLAAGLAVVAYAAPGQTDPLDPPNPPGPRGGAGRGPMWWPPHLAGEVSTIGEDQFTLITTDNNTFTVEVNDLTSYIGGLESFADLEVGLDVAVVGHRSGEGSLVARVVATRDDLPIGIPIGGEVTAVGADSITIETPRGQTFSFGVSAETDYLSRENDVESLADIEVSDHVMVLFEQSGEGSLVANLIMVGGPADGAMGN